MTATPVPLRAFDREPGAVLVASPSAPVRMALETMLRDRADLLTAETAEQVLAQAATQRIACAILDDRLTDLVPADLAARMTEQEPSACVILLRSPATAPVTDDPRVVHLDTPVEPIALGLAVDSVLRRSDALRESDQINRWLAEEVSARTEELRQERDNLKHLSVASLEALVNALEAKDHHLRGHSARVAELAGAIAQALGAPAEVAEAVRVAGRLHDIGKIGLPEAVLRKEGPLTDEEFAQVQLHPGLGAQILAPLDHLGEVLQFVRHHHERWDGAGYPDGLAGEAIPIGARIIGAVETFDALTTPRPYQEIMPPGQAVERMAELVGTVIDPAVHRALAAVVAGREAA